MGCSVVARSTLFYIFGCMALTIQESIDTVFLDTPHYDVVLKFSSGYEDLDALVVSRVDGLIPFTLVDGKLETQQFTIDTFVTAKQNRLLQALYLATVHSKYIDQRYPVIICWGIMSDSQYTNQVECYLSNYTPPDSVDYKSADILGAKFVLRAI